MQGIYISVKVQPCDQKNALISYENEILKIKLNAIPEKGKANKALIEFLSKSLGISKNRITLVSGETSRYKKVFIEHLSENDFNEKVNSLLTKKQF